MNKIYHVRAINNKEPPFILFPFLADFQLAHIRSTTVKASKPEHQVVMSVSKAPVPARLLIYKDVPPEILDMILAHFDTDQLSKLRDVCTLFRDAVDSLVWAKAVRLFGDAHPSELFVLASVADSWRLAIGSRVFNDKAVVKRRKERFGAKGGSLTGFLLPYFLCRSRLPRGWSWPLILTRANASSPHNNLRN